MCYFWYLYDVDSENESKVIFKGSLDQIKIFNDPDMAEDQCETNFKVSIQNNKNIFIEKKMVQIRF